MRTALVGTLESTRITLDALVRHGVPPEVVCTLPKSKAFRHSDFVDIPAAAEKHNIPVIEAANSNSPDVIAQLRDLQLDHVMVIGWSQICKPEFLALSGRGSIGYHPAPLPENRGRGVIPWTILQNRTETGATMFWMDDGMDTGDILVQETFAVASDETVTTLFDKHMQALDRMLERAVPDLIAGNAPHVPQDHSRATWCAKRTAVDGLIDWNLPAEEVFRLIRAVGRPYPGAFTFDEQRKITVWQARWIGAAPYWGLPGQIQAFKDDGAIVQCGDRKHLLLTEVQIDDQPPTMAQGIFKIHRKLGLNLLDLLDLYERLQNGDRS